MSKTIPLILASIKGFVRNWKSVLLLVVTPLLLIGSIFFSFNPDGLQRIPIGIVNTDALEIDDFMETANYFMKVSEFGYLDTCLSELKRYNQYVCIEIEYNNYILFNVHFDNTREPIIWEVVQKIKATVDYLQKERTKEIATDVLSEFKNSIDDIENVRIKLINVNSQIKDHIDEFNQTVDDFKDNYDLISVAQEDMFNSISYADSYVTDLEAQSDYIHASSLDRVNYLEQKADSLSDLEGYNLVIMADIESALDNMKTDLEISSNVMDNELSSLHGQIGNIDSGIKSQEDEIANTKNFLDSLEEESGDISEYKTMLDEIEDEFPSAASYRSLVDDIDPELLVNPIVVRNNQTYIPKITDINLGTQDLNNIMKGVNLIGLQTLFPQILILITLFLSLLISSFNCLNDINSPANERMKTIRGTFLPEMISIFISSIIIILIPLTCIMLLGHYLFLLPILEKLGLVILLMVMLSSIFILVGMALAYLIKKESITLLVATFLLVFLVFISGFILPIERMSYLPNLIALNSPGTMVLYAFNKVVFYGQNISSIEADIFSLIVWLIALLLAVLVIKKMRNV